MAEDFDFVAARNATYDSALTVFGKSVLLQLIEHMPHCRPGMSRICLRTSLSKSQVIREIRNLERLGIVVVSRASGAGNEYVLTEGWKDRLPVSTGNRFPPDTGSHQTPDWCPPDTGVVSTRHLTGVPQTPKAGKKQELKQEGKQRENARTSQPRTSKSKSSKAETELPADWQPSEQHEAFAAEHHIDLGLEVMKFRGYYDGKKALSWNGRFSTWLGNAIGFARERGPRKVQPVQQGLAPNIKFGSIDEGFGPQPNDPANRYDPAKEGIRII